LPHVYYKTFGALNVKEHALPNSIIGVDDYDSSMKDLAAYLQKVAANKRRCTKPIMLGANNLFRNRFIENTILHRRIPLLSTLSMGACHETQARMGSRATTTCAYKNEKKNGSQPAELTKQPKLSVTITSIRGRLLSRLPSLESIQTIRAYPQANEKFGYKIPNRA
jgi:hypothetical protein